MSFGASRLRRDPAPGSAANETLGQALCTKPLHPGFGGRRPRRSHESTQATIVSHRVSFEFADVRTFSSSLERYALHSSK
jgi:hypothetical protein